MKIEMTLSDGTRWTYERVDGDEWDIRTTAGDGIDGPIFPCSGSFGDQDVLLAVADGIVGARRRDAEIVAGSSTDSRRER